MSSQLGGLVGGSLGPTFDELSDRRIYRSFPWMRDLMRAQLGGFPRPTRRKRTRKLSRVFSLRKLPRPYEMLQYQPATALAKESEATEKKQRRIPGGAGNTAEVELERRGRGKRRRSGGLNEKTAIDVPQTATQTTTAQHVMSTMDAP